MRSRDVAAVEIAGAPAAGGRRRGATLRGVQPRTQDRIARAAGYVLGAVVALLVLGWTFYKLWVVVCWL